MENIKKMLALLEMESLPFTPRKMLLSKFKRNLWRNAAKRYSKEMGSCHSINSPSTNSQFFWESVATVEEEFIAELTGATVCSPVFIQILKI